jgi:uncharacterized protein (TIGR02217 family)
MTHLSDKAPFIAGYGYSRRLLYRTTVVTAASGLTERDSRWSYPLHVFSLPLANRTQPDLEQIIDYYHAAGGRAHTFDFHDLSEDRSCAQAATPAQTDQTLGTASASQTDFQIIKTYGAALGRSQARKITRPVAASVLVEVDGALQTVATDYTLQAGGIVRFNTGLTAGQVVKAGFQFYVPVAFVSDDVDIAIHNRSAGIFVGDAAVELAEVRE